MEKEIISILDSYGIKSYLKGYSYLVDSIQKYNNLSINEIYKEISIMHNVTSASVERSIRYLIEESFKYKICNYYDELHISFNKIKPTNKQFISTINKKLKLVK